jgi:DNA-binding Xre family transcriptional regulator
MTGKHKPQRQHRDAAEKIPNFVKEWRLYRGLESQTALAKKSGVLGNTICRLEAHTQAYTWATLCALATALACKPGDLISTDPYRSEARERIARLYESLPPQKQSLAEATILFLKGITP